MAIDLNMPILVVDDYRTMARIIHNLLSQLGFPNVDEANDGMEALRKMEVKQYGLVISDWNMEPMNGLDLLRSVRRARYNSRVPFIMVTAESKQSSVQAAKEAGVTNYIVKPFSANTLRLKLESTLARNLSRDYY